MSDKFTVEIISPDQTVLKQETKEVIIPGLKNVIRGIWLFKIPIWPSKEGITTSLVSFFKIVWSGLIISTVNLSDIIYCL